jgi:hypothetical protein
MCAVVTMIVAFYARIGVALSRAFPDSVYAAATWNFPPQAVCCPHRDAGNAPCLPCSVTALGNFKADDGGELVLYELGLIIRFPAVLQYPL